ncbi:MAG: hypothetical protein M5T61_09435, partial [Acidimicrobiia bacterium]|nr:hypothetical protein [Acidimicrobiia bacterium]
MGDADSDRRPFHSAGDIALSVLDRREELETRRDVELRSLIEAFDLVMIRRRSSRDVPDRWIPCGSRVRS